MDRPFMKACSTSGANCVIWIGWVDPDPHEAFPLLDNNRVSLGPSLRPFITKYCDRPIHRPQIQ